MTTPPAPREVARILRAAADKVERGDAGGTLFDSDGNGVGEFTFRGTQP